MNESQYYAPIIEAMLSTQKLRQEQVRSEQEQQRIDAEKKARDIAAKQAQQQIDQAHEMQLNAHKIALGHLNLQAQQEDLKAKMAKIEALKGLQDVARGAAPGFLQQTPDIGRILSTPTPQLPQSTQQPGSFMQSPQWTGYAPGVSQQLPQAQPQQAPAPDLSGLYSPETEAANIRATAAAKSGGAAEGELPFQKQLLDWKNENEKAITQMHTESAEKIAKLSRDAQVAIANMHNNTELKRLSLEFGGTPEQSKALVIGGLTGEIKLNPANPLQRAAFTSIHEMGGRDFDPKDAEALKQGQALVPIFDQLKKFAKKLPTSKTGAFLQGHTLGAAEALGIPTDLQTELNNITAQAINLGRQIEGLTGGRMNLRQLELDLKALASGHLREQDALARLDNLKNLYTNKMENVIMAGLPDFQKALIYHRYDIRPSFLLDAPAKSKNGKSLDVDASISAGTPVYK